MGKLLLPVLEAEKFNIGMLADSVSSGCLFLLHSVSSHGRRSKQADLRPTAPSPNIITLEIVSTYEFRGTQTLLP